MKQAQTKAQNTIPPAALNVQDSPPASGRETVQRALSWMCVKVKDAYLQDGELGPINEKLLCGQLTSGIRGCLQRP